MIGFFQCPLTLSERIEYYLGVHLPDAPTGLLVVGAMFVIRIVFSKNKS